MLDIVSIIQEKAESLGYKFDYGKKDWINLLRSDVEVGRIYFLLDPVKINPEKTKFGGFGKISCKGDFLIAVKSNLDNVIHQQKNQDKENGKYLKNVRPLLEEIEKFFNLFSCDNFELIINEIVDIYNYLDVNIDGLIVTYTIKE